MGDFRTLIKIRFRMGSVDRKGDFNINWSPSHCGVDQRIIDWFHDVGEEASAKIREDVYEGELKARRQQKERRERAELARLKEKYE